MLTGDHCMSVLEFILFLHDQLYKEQNVLCCSLIRRSQPLQSVTLYAC